MIRTGTTTFQDMYFFPEASAEVVDKSGMRACIGSPVIKFPTAYAKDLNEYFLKAELFAEKFKNHARIKPVITPHATYTVPDEGFKKLVEFAKKHGISIHTHLHETEFEVINEKREEDQSPIRPINRLRELGVLGSHFSAAHMVWASDEDIKLLQTTKSSVIHNPMSNMKLASGIAPIKKLLESGVNVCLGTDSAASNDDLDMFSEMKAAALLAKLKENSGKALSALDVLKMATINGAKALGFDKKIGSLTLGKRADFIAVKLRSKPVYDPIVSLVYVATNRVTDVWVDGKQLLKNEDLLTLNQKDLDSKAHSWEEKIKITQQAHANKQL